MNDNIETPPFTATLREAPLSKPDLVELHPDVQGENRPQSFHNYLDEFLLAVRVFGFLEKPVCFHIHTQQQHSNLIQRNLKHA
jgi:lysophospholipid hydrolase